MAIFYPYHGYPVRWRTHLINQGEFPMGLEWEVTNTGRFITNNDYPVFDKVLEKLGNKRSVDDIIFAFDGSLHGDGVEIISHPATLSYHLDETGVGYNWKAACKYLDEELHWTGEDSGLAGIHISIDRESINDKQENLLLLVLNNMEWLKRFSRRHVHNNWGYCAFPPDYTTVNPLDVHTNPDRVRRNLKSRIHNMDDHHVCVNFDHGKGIELRFFASTTFWKYFYGNLQLCNMIAWCCKHMSLEECAAVRLPWFEMFAQINGYEYFLQTCKARKVNVSSVTYPL